MEKRKPGEEKQMNRIKKADRRKRQKNKGERKNAQDCDFHSALFRNGTAIPAMTQMHKPG
jgi:DNA-binding FadR family transcriptional regulator